MKTPSLLCRMRHSIHVLALVAIILLCTPWAAKGQFWQVMPDFPDTERDDGTRFILNNVAYCGTGLTPWWTELGDFYSFNMNNDTWSTVAPLPVGEERQYACGFSSASNGYVFGGYSEGAFLNDLWKYDPGADSWSEQSPLPADGRSGASYFTIDDTAYIIGGRTSSLNAVTEIWAYSMTSDTWTAKNDFPFDSLWRAAATSDNGSGYLMFGRSPTNEYHDEVYKYTPTNDSWIQLPVFPGLGRTYSSVSPVMGKLLVFGGLDSLGASYNDLWQFDTLLGVWSELSSIPALERRGGIAFYSASAIYYTAGIDQNNTRLRETWKNENPSDLLEISKFELSVYPNPVSSILHLQTHSTELSIDSYSLVDQFGRTILSKGGSLPEWIDLTAIPAGIYQLELRGPLHRTRKKIVKI